MQKGSQIGKHGVGRSLGWSSWGGADCVGTEANVTRKGDAIRAWG